MGLRNCPLWWSPELSAVVDSGIVCCGGLRNRLLWWTPELSAVVVSGIIRCGGFSGIVRCRGLLVLRGFFSEIFGCGGSLSLGVVIGDSQVCFLKLSAVMIRWGAWSTVLTGGAGL